MHLLRIAPILCVLAASQVAIYLALRAVFASAAEQRGRRRALRLGLAAAAVAFAGYVWVVRAGVELPPWVRWLAAYPVLSWYLLSIPLSVALGLAVSAARRWPRAVATPAAAETALPESRRIFLARATTGLLGAAGAFAAFGVAEQERAPALTRRDIFLPNLHPDLEGLTLLQLSDIHAGPLIDEARMAAFARAAAALEPDVVVLTGDLLDSSARSAEPFVRAFSGLRGRLGTFAVLGNHDYYASAGAAVEAVRALGGQTLINRGVHLERGGGSLFLGGVDDPIAWGRSTVRVDPEAALRGAGRDEARIVLAHRPQLFPLCADAGAQLVLSGHTHGGQFAFSPRFSMARLIGPYTMGMYRRGPAQLYVHRGMGVVAAAPLRVGSPPELALFTLRRA